MTSVSTNFAMRKAFTYGVFFIACLLGASTADAVYIIKLKNGNEYVTARYWEEGAQVCFDTYNGIFGIERSFIAKIEKAERAVLIARALDQEPPAQPQGVSSKKEGEAVPEEKGGEAIKKDRDPNDPIIGEFNRLKEKATEVDGMLTSEVRDLLTQITVFKNKLAKDSKAFIQYAREFNELNEIGSTVETALRSRTQ